jgi:hypothetical protein
MLSFRSLFKDQEAYCARLFLFQPVQSIIPRANITLCFSPHSAPMNHSLVTNCIRNIHYLLWVHDSIILKVSPKTLKASPNRASRHDIALPYYSLSHSHIPTQEIREFSDIIVHGPCCLCRKMPTWNTLYSMPLVGVIACCPPLTLQVLVPESLPSLSHLGPSRTATALCFRPSCLKAASLESLPPFVA